ncbi:MAG: hypothetical protein QNJ57_13375 [Flavobacteriaceae bacterium]|nr:hypothetical protein [Flavobacteriaceae bacterium]
MKKFITRTIFISLPIVFFLVGLEIVSRKIPNNYKYKSSYLDKNASTIETLILGSSHSFRGVDPVYFSSNAFNASHVSQTLDYDIEIINRYQTKFSNLKTIYIPISYFTFWGKLNTSIESWRCRLYYNSYGISKDISTMQRLEISNFKINTSKTFRYILKGEDDKTCSTLGWGATFESKNSKNITKSGIIAAKRHTKLIHSEESIKIFESNTNLLQNLIVWSASKDIEVVLFTPPAWKSYRENLSKEQLEVTVKTASNFADNHDNCTYLNMLSDISFTLKDFYDADHVSQIGAKKLSLKLNSLAESNKKEIPPR